MSSFRTSEQIRFGTFEKSSNTLLRKGIVDIPLMFILNLTRSADAVVWATPITDILSCAVAVILFEQSLLYLEQKFETKASYKAPANSF